MEIRRSGNGYQANPISHQDIIAWCDRFNVRFRLWEQDCLDEMERSRLLFIEESASSDDIANDNEMSEQGMTPALFDALF